MGDMTIDKARALQEAATGGPWCNGWDDTPSDDAPLIRAQNGTAVCAGGWWDGLRTMCTREDAALMAAAPDLVRWGIDHAELSEARRQSLVAAETRIAKLTRSVRHLAAKVYGTNAAYVGADAAFALLADAAPRMCCCTYMAYSDGTAAYPDPPRWCKACGVMTPKPGDTPANVTSQRHMFDAPFPLQAAALLNREAPDDDQD